MTWDDLLTAVVREYYQPSLPTVRNKKDGRIGTITVIKNNGKFKGCAVQYLDQEYDVWFYAEPGTDKRSKYMEDLELFEIPCNIEDEENSKAGYKRKGPLDAPATVIHGDAKQELTKALTKSDFQKVAKEEAEKRWSPQKGKHWVRQLREARIEAFIFGAFWAVTKN